MRIKAALFDLDGTLVDSMWVWERILPDFLEEHSLPVYDRILDEVGHMSPVQSSVYVKEKYQLSMSAEEIHQRWMEMAQTAYADKVKLKSGAKEYLSKLKEEGVRLAITTACDPILVDVCLKHNGVDTLFDTIVYVDDVGKGKDFPDIYIEALRRLDSKPEESMIFEDILTGIRTAKKLGIMAVAVADARQTNAETLRAESDIYIRDFFELL